MINILMNQKPGLASSTSTQENEPISEHNQLTSHSKSDSMTGYVTKQKDQLTHKTLTSRGDVILDIDSAGLKQDSENGSSTKELGEKFDSCITRMEGSFVKAIQELSRTQNDIFVRAMTSIKCDITSSVIKELRPVIQNEMTSLKDSINAELMSMKDGQVDNIHTEKKQLQVQINEMKSAHHEEMTKMRDSYHQKLDLQGEKHRNKTDAVVEKYEAEIRTLQSKYKQEIAQIQEQKESEVKNLKVKINDCETEIISLKLHNSRCSDLNQNSEGVQIAGSRGNKSNEQNSASSTDVIVLDGESTNNNSNNKPYVLLIGTSNITKIREDKLTSEISVVKRIAYTIPETLEAVRNFQCDHPPREVVFHSFTNDIKTETPDRCIELFDEVIKLTQSRWKDTKIVISLETARADNSRINTSVKILNALLEQKFLEASNIYLCTNSNFFTNGEPDKTLLHSDDLYHLSDKGASRLAMNIKAVIHSSLGLDPPQIRAKKPGFRGFDFHNSANFPFQFIPPGYFINRRGNGRGGRGRRYYQK